MNSKAGSKRNKLVRRKVAKGEANREVSVGQLPPVKQPLARSSSLDDDGNGSGYLSEGERKSGGQKRKRIFRARDSILTDLARNDPNAQALYHAFIVMCVTGIMYSLLKDSVEAGTPHVDFGFFVSGFGPLHQTFITFTLWLPLQVAALAVYPVFRVWAVAHGSAGAVADLLAVLLVAAYNVLAHCAVVLSIVNYDLPPIPALILAVEQLRFSLKSYSFIRENAYKVLYPWHKDDESGPTVWYEGQMEPSVGTFSKYLYFLFAPSLLYRDNYPRNPEVRKLRVLAHLLKCCISLAFITILVRQVFGASFPQNWQILAKTFLSCLLWGLVIQFMAGYFFLHSWNNLFGELLRFGDRQFYSDWWTCSSFSQFYRKWNLLVHDWIKAYIYQDFKENKLFNKIAFLPALVMSAVYHEYVLWAPLRFVMPVLLTQFCTFGVVFFVMKPSPKNFVWNYVLHTALQIGVSIMVFCYAMEFYARKICPKEESALNTFVPRFYECFLRH